MKKTIVLTLSAVIFIAGSLLAFANMDNKQCPPNCCDTDSCCSESSSSCCKK